MVLFLFLTHLALGVVFTLVFVSREAGVKFFRFNAGLAVALLAAAFAFQFRPADMSRLSAGGAGWYGLLALGVSSAAILIYWLTVGRALASIRPWIVRLAVAAGLIAIVAQALDVATAGPAVARVLAVVSFLTSAALLGTACTAMILGHWYLVIPSMEVSHLQSIVKLHIGAMVLRVASVAAAVLFAIVTWEPGAGPDFGHYITSISGIFFWQRVLFGLFGPALLSFLTWETAKIRSTQSATGILYVDFFTVVVGEVLAKYILLATRVPV